MKRTFNILLIGGMIIAPIALMIIPAGYFDHGQSMCLSVLLLHKTCPGCGMTRAFEHIIHGQFAAAWQFNKLSFLLFPAAVFLWARELRRLFKSLRPADAVSSSQE